MYCVGGDKHVVLLLFCLYMAGTAFLFACFSYLSLHDCFAAVQINQLLFSSYRHGQRYICVGDGEDI